jgi:AraC-like DNA-binding protein
MSLSDVASEKDDILQLRDVGRYIHEHYGEDISVRLLSKVACMSSTKFKTTFREVYGITVHSYVQQVRMDAAINLLGQSDMSIAAIAQAVGYRKPGAFTAVFKRKKGMLPSYFRNMRSG